MATARSESLRELAQRIADGLPAPVEEVILTGSVSRGVADELSDVEMLVVTSEQVTLAAAFAMSGLPDPQSWGVQGTPWHRVFGYRDGVPIEQIWWSLELAEERVETAPEAIANGIVLRTRGRASAWQERLRHYPEVLGRERIEEAAETWGGYAPEGVLTLTRPGERLARTQRMVGDAERIVRIVFALNRVWEPTLKRLSQRVEPLAVKPDRFVERLDAAFAADDFLALTELARDAVELAPDGPNVVRARVWLAAAAEALR